MSISEIAQNTDMSRNTVAKYLKKMYEKDILQGPYLRVKPAQNYTEYVYLMEPWVQCAYQVEDYLHEFEPELTPTQRNILPKLPWGNKEWTLFSAFYGNIRKKITPTLKKIEMRYEEYTAWKNGLDMYCTPHTGFYPQGYTSYAHHCFLVSSEYEPQVKKVFSFFPTTSFFMEVGKSLLVIVSVPDPTVIRWLYCVINAMKAYGIIKKFWHAHFVFHEDLRGLTLQRYIK
jgi:hypothetical protein